MDNINVDKLFDFIGVIFSDDDRYERLNNSDKAKHFFMTNRFFSIMFPVQACTFSVLDVNPVGVLDSWRMIGKRYKKTPRWVYTKTKSVNKKEKQAYVPTQEAIDYFLAVNEIGMKEFNDIIKLNNDKLIDILKAIDNQIIGFKKEK